MTSRFRLLCCISILITFIFCNTTTAKVPQKSLRWTGKLLADAYRSYNKYSSDHYQRWDAMYVKSAFIRAIQKYGKDTRLYAGLADSQMLLAEYGDAVRNYKIALELSPRDKTLKNRLDIASQSDYVSKLAIGYLPKTHKVIRAVHYPDGNSRIWLVLSATVQKQTYNIYSDIRLTVFKVERNKLHKLWQTDELCYSKPELAEAESIQLIFKDITGDKKPEIIVPAVFVGGSWIPSHLAIFKWENGKMHMLLGVRSDMPLLISDLNHDGKYEVSNEYCIGSSMCHAEMPRWKDIYAYKNGTFQLADGDFPNQYRNLAIEIRQKLRKYPDDWELHKYQGVIYQIQHRNIKALHSYKHALRILRDYLRDENDKEYKSHLAYKIQDIEHRIDRIKK